jgi:glutathione reductase (NADPH)
VAKLLERTRGLGVTFHPKATLEAIEKATTRFQVHASIDGRAETFETDLVVHGAGRVPVLDAFAIETANVRFGKKGVEVSKAPRTPRSARRAILPPARAGH